MEGFQATVPPDFVILGGLRRSLTAWLEKTGVADPPRDDVVLATHEAAANAIEHAGSASPIDVRARLVGRTLTIEITDSGRWKDANPADEERGRGLILIAGLVSEMKLQAGTSGTTLRLVVHA